MSQLFFQQLPISDANVDKLLGANFLSLALIALVMVVAMFLLFVWMNNRREAANDKRQDVMIRIFTDEQSPLVQSSVRSATAIEIGNTRSAEQTNALVALGHKTDQQTASIEAQTSVVSAQSLDFRNYQTLVSDGLSNHSTQVENNTAVVAALKVSIDALNIQIREVLQDTLACASIELSINRLRDEVSDFLDKQSKRNIEESTNGFTPDPTS